MRAFHLSVILLTVIIGVLSLATAVEAQTQDVCFLTLLDGQLQTDGLHLQVTITAWGWTTYCWTDNFVGVDVFRRTLGSQCGPPVRITEEPLPWNHQAVFDEPFVLADIVDTGVTANTAYQYEAVAVDAQRNPVPGNSEVILGFASTGVALIGHGILTRGPDCGISSVDMFSPCAGQCYASALAFSVPPEAVPYFNSGTPLLIYGEFDGTFGGFCNSYIPVVNVSSVEESPCVVGVTPTTWGAVKMIYR
jgi:hypothetical protein